MPSSTSINLICRAEQSHNSPYVRFGISTVVDFDNESEYPGRGHVMESYVIIGLTSPVAAFAAVLLLLRIYNKGR